jgi:SAM-dependent methyltransferase
MIRKAKSAVRWLLERTTFGYLALLRRDYGARGPCGQPEAPWHNAVLKTFDEQDQALNQVAKLGLPAMPNKPKNWDTLAALDSILRATNREAFILDAGAETYSRILPWLSMYGYRRLHGINLVFDREFRRGPITYRHGDITRTDYADETFDAITCLSVVEHGVNLEAYLKEMRRILKPGGLLITSTDYWQTSIDTHGQQFFGVPVKVLTEEEIRKALKFAIENGFAMTGPIDFSCNEKVVHWTEVDLYFTFLVLTLQKPEQITPAQSRV